MDWIVIIKVGTTLNHCRWRNPNLLVWTKHAPNTPNKTPLEIQQLSRLRTPGRLNFSHRTAVGACRSRSNLLGNRNEIPQECSCAQQRPGVLGSTVLDYFLHTSCFKL